MVEEFMLLANIYTAEKTRTEFPHSAVLRRHPRPPVDKFHPLIKVAHNKVFSYTRCALNSQLVVLNTVALCVREMFWKRLGTSRL